MNKRLTAAALSAALLFCLGGVPAAAETQTVDEKTITFSETADGGVITAEPNQPAVWEFPVIPAGQARKAGTLRLRNDSSSAIHFQLKEIQLPYGDNAALAYLDALRITVTEGEQTLYDGPYSRIADEGGLKLDMKDWAPGAVRELSIALRCSFAYEGDPAQASKEISWVFAVSAPGSQDNSADMSTVQPPADEKADMVTIVIVCVAGARLLLCVAAGVVSFVRKRRR